MTKGRSPNREKAFAMYKESGGRIKSKAIADELGEKIANIYSWKKKDEWDKNLKGKPGAPVGNKNAMGNNGGAPEGNLNALKDGSYIDENKLHNRSYLRKYIPKITDNIMNDVENSGISTLDILWDNIMLCYTSIIRSQKIMHVKNKNDLTKVKKKEGWGDSGYDEYELQFAWDKQERFIKTQASAMNTLSKMLKQYDEMLHNDWDLATQEQKLRIETLKAKLNDNKNTAEQSVQIVDDIDE